MGVSRDYALCRNNENNRRETVKCHLHRGLESGRAYTSLGVSQYYGAT